MKRVLFIVAIFAVIFNLAAVNVSFDTDGNGKDDKWLSIDVYKKWQKIDINENDKPDETCLYTSSKNIVYFVKEEKYDYTGNGKPDIWVTNRLNGKSFETETKADSNSDGKVDLITKSRNDVLYLKKTDNDLDGIFEVEEEFNEDGEKIKESVDSNNDGKLDDFYYYRGGINYREEIDSNFDGKTDLWVIFEYNMDASLKECRIEKDNNFDGKVDEWHYSDDKRRVIKIEKDKNYDGKVDEVKNLGK